MIRINLIATAKGKRRARPGMPDIPNVGLLLFVLLLVIESAVLYSMHASASEQAERYSRKLTKVKRDLGSAKKTHAELTAVRKEVGRLRTQALLFEELDAEKTGPVGALSFLSFILKPRDEASHSADELKQMEAAGWRVSWDANRAWFTFLSETLGVVTLRGAAIHHDDVAEVLRRLESSAHFRNVKLVWQERHHHLQLNRDYIVFTLKSDLIYLVDPYLTAEQRAEKEATAAEEKAAEVERKGSGANKIGDKVDQAADTAGPAVAETKAGVAERRARLAARSKAERAAGPVVRQPAAPTATIDELAATTTVTDAAPPKGNRTPPKGNRAAPKPNQAETAGEVQP